MADHTIQGFLFAARENEAACLNKYSGLIILLDKMAKALRDMIGQSPGSPLEGRALVENVLLMNSYNLYLSAVRIALSGQSPPVFAVLRACLESALYAVIATQDEAYRTIWVQRAQNRKECGNLFKKSKATEYLKEFDPNLAACVIQCYDALIDLGAHPNSSSVLDHLSFETRDDGEAVTLTFLHNVGSPKILQSLSACFETGVVVLYLGRHALPEYKPALAAHRISKILHDEFHELVKSYRGEGRKDERGI